MKELKQKYTPVLQKIIENKLKVIQNPIFVFAGIEPYINCEPFEPFFVDKETFNVDGNADTYTTQWMCDTFTKLCAPKPYQILSHQQFAYLSEMLNINVFEQRTVIIYDNLRTLYPIPEAGYIEQVSLRGLEERPESLPIYQAEQFKIGNEYFYSLKQFSGALNWVPLFKEKKKLEPISNGRLSYETIDISSNPYAIDCLINSYLKSKEFNKYVAVKISPKNLQNKETEEILEQANYVLSCFGGGILKQPTEIIQRDYMPSEKSLSLLKKYWGENANFRDIEVYENPIEGNEKIPVSQGQIVDTIIEEYEKGSKGETPRDIFITAPTGAGKSLIFQLPAFYAAEHNDVTIVVSPLKALMADQVINLRNEHHYNRVEFINSDLNLIDRESIIRRCKEGEVDIIYLSPELLLSYDIHYFIGERKLGLMIIDEAHLITTWGRDFRVDYWFLGNHIFKIRKFSDYKFPMVALTATAVFGGVNDMVYDSISSLNMHDPHLYIGNVKRDDIEFVIDTHDAYPDGRYDTNKEKETVKFIEEVHKLGLKTIVYAPYTTHVAKLQRGANEVNPDMAVSYYGSLDQNNQREAYNQYKRNLRKIMIATKAFGMGIDIPDIQVVYHHAPSGLLPDYIQEIGRAARKTGMRGYAALTFSPNDLRYSKQLFGMSSLKTFQLKQVLQRIIKFYNANGRKRNMLISTSDFAYIFNQERDVDQKVATALMMIEKDYLMKSRFNVLIARPKKLFTKVYARTNLVGLNYLAQRYRDCYKEIPSSPNYDVRKIELDLDKIWCNHFSDRSFPQVKSEFYKGEFLKNEGIDLAPQIKVIHSLEQPVKDVKNTLSLVLDAVSNCLKIYSQNSKFFTEAEFNENLKLYLGGKYDVGKITSFILNTYAANSGSYGVDELAFLQRRHQGGSYQYHVNNSQYSARFTRLNTLFNKLFPDDSSLKTWRMVSLGEDILKNHICLGSLLEILGKGTFETQGGEDPKLFIRINDPDMIKKDSVRPDYSNFILESVKRRHKVSCRIFEYFFTNYFDNEKRWDFIEDFFLGCSSDDLLDKYPSKTKNHVNIIEFLRRYATDVEPAPVKKEEEKDEAQNSDGLQGGFLGDHDLLTINNKAYTVTHWVSEDPVLLHQTITERGINISRKLYATLTSKLKTHHFEYYRDFMRLRILIKYPGYDDKVMASIPYKDDPVNFYKWWRKNKFLVSLNHEEEIRLYIAVYEANPKALIKQHRNMINRP